MIIVPNPLSNYFAIQNTTNQLISIKLVATDGRTIPIVNTLDYDFYLVEETADGIAFLEIVDFKGEFTRYKILIEK
jgi:hypothetical protein